VSNHELEMYTVGCDANGVPLSLEAKTQCNERENIPE